MRKQGIQEITVHGLRVTVQVTVLDNDSGSSVQAKIMKTRVGKLKQKAGNNNLDWEIKNRSDVDGLGCPENLGGPEIHS